MGQLAHLFISSVLWDCYGAEHKRVLAGLPMFISVTKLTMLYGDPSRGASQRSLSNLKDNLAVPSFQFSDGKPRLWEAEHLLRVTRVDGEGTNKLHLIQGLS